MRGSLKKMLLFVVGFATIALAAAVVNQTLQLAEFASRIHPRAGTVVFWGLIVAYLVCLAVPAVLYWRLPSALSPPESDEGPEFEQYLVRLRRRLAVNPLTAELPLRERQEIERAIEHLDRRAGECMRRSASRVFLTTAVSQNGSLDALVVLVAQVKLVWDIAHVYSQRPTLRDMGSLYSNVLGTAFVAGQIEDIDLSQQIQPVISTVLGSAAGAVPGLQAASTVALTSVVTGSANALLTLRIGLIASEYSRALVRPDRSLLRRAATVRAAGMLGSVVAEQAARVTRAIFKASGRSVGSVLSGVGSRVKDAVSRLPFRERTDPEGEGER